MGKRTRKKWDLPSGQGGALAVLSLAFALGGGVGCLLAALADGEGGQELCAYLSDYLVLAENGQVSSGLLQIFWEHMRYLLAALVLGFTALGVVCLPVLFGIRGFFLSFSVTCFCRVFGGRGLLPAFVVLGLSALFWAPALFLTGVQSLSSAQQLLRRLLGDGRGSISLQGAYWCRAGLCIGLTFLASLLEFWVVPELLRAAAHVVL